MENMQSAKKLEEEICGDFWVPEELRDLGRNLKYENPKINKKLSFDEIINLAVRGKEIDLLARYFFQNGDKDTAHQLYYKYLSNLKLKNKNKLERIGLVAEEIGLPYEAFKKFVRTKDYFRAIYNGKKANISIPVKYIEIGINNLKNRAVSPGIIDLAEIVGNENEDVKELFINVLNNFEDKGDYFEAGRMADAIGEYERAMDNYIKEKNYVSATIAAKKAGLDEKAKDILKLNIKDLCNRDKFEFIEPTLKKVKPYGVILSED